MADVNARAGLKRVAIEAVVIRADGSRESLGVVSDSTWGFLSPRRWLADWRIRRANKRVKEN